MLQPRFTDDTSMALCLADALLEREGKIDPNLIGRNILDWALVGHAFNETFLVRPRRLRLTPLRATVNPLLNWKTTA
ncbi:ADP-ribosylglycohydrolase family protein [Escherichia coli]